ncbi:hypothetical protein KAJ27_11475 [bacterium]|nr:hypothetical protein [bacterium]
MCNNPKIIATSFLVFLFLALAIFPRVSLIDNTLVLTNNSKVIVYKSPQDFQFESYHQFKNDDICIVGSFNPAKYKRLDIIRPVSSTSSFIVLFSSQEFYLPEVNFLNSSVEITHQIPLEKYSHSDCPIKITSIIKSVAGKYIKTTGKLQVKDNPVYLYYFAKLQYKKLKLQKSFRYFDLFYKQINSKTPLREETIYYLCRISSFLNKKNFIKFYTLLKNEYPSSPYLEVFENKDIVTTIEKSIFLGTQYYLKGDFVKSLTYTLESLKLAEDLKRLDYLPKIYYKLALLYEKKGKLIQAKKMFMEVIHLKTYSIYMQFAREKIQELSQ